MWWWFLLKNKHNWTDQCLGIYKHQYIYPSKVENNDEVCNCVMFNINFTKTVILVKMHLSKTRSINIFYMLISVNYIIKGIGHQSKTIIIRIVYVSYTFFIQQAIIIK